jgi:hypothetical protein
MINFDSKYVEALTLQADEILKSARAMPASPPPAPRPMTNPPHPRFTFTQKDIIGEITFFESLQDGEGTENGRFWISGGNRIGWDGEAYQKIRRLASKVSTGKPLGEFASMKFALEETFAWLRRALERGQDRPLAEHLKARCEEELFQGEIWIPLSHTYANSPFTIGKVAFRAIHKNMMDAWYSRFDSAQNPEAKAAMNAERASLQATLAACTTVCAEPQKALEIALERTSDATALLRFLSIANWSCKIRSSTVPTGTQEKNTVTSLSVVEGAIKNITKGVTEPLPRPWNVTENIKLLPEILMKLHDLALNNDKTELRKSLYESLLIYSRNNLTTDLSEKLLFVLVALESLLLLDGNEAIQGNLAERLAFLAGPTLEERRLVVETTRTVYRLRSNFVHHGKAVEDVEALERFLNYAWNALAAVLTSVDTYASRGDLISYLNDRRLA